MRTLLCGRCGEYKEANRIDEHHCKDCHAEYMRESRQRHSELTPEQRKKANCRSYANVYITRGRIKKQPCSKCGCDNAEMHHEDYDKPLEIVWLCRECHLDLHLKRKTV